MVNVYTVTFGPAMDRVDFPYTDAGLTAAASFMAKNPSGALGNPNRADLDFDGILASEWERFDEITASLCGECGSVMQDVPEAGVRVRCCTGCEHVDAPVTNVCVPGYNPAAFRRPGSSLVDGRWR